MTSDHPVIDEVPVDVATARVYAEGWQSWSPATWYPVTATSRRPEGGWQHLMRFRPGTPVAAGGIQAEGLLVVEPGDGSARLYAAADRLAVPTLRATLEGATLVVRASDPVVTRTRDDGAEAALAAYAAEIAVPLRPPPTVWCSWYRYFEEVTAADVAANLAAFKDRDLPVDVVQIDDGWSCGLGEGLVVRDRFGSLPDLVDRIRGTGRRAGIWLAPFLVGADTTLAHEHPDWLSGPAGYNWGQDLVGLDLEHPAVRDLLTDHLERLVALGIDYLKLDFLYAGALGGEAAYRSGLDLVREVVGPDVYLVGCGAPLLPSVGVFDAMRVSPDTFHEGGEDGSTGLRGLMPLAARAWQQGRLWVNDPDCVVARPTYSQREPWAAAAQELGGLASFSDAVAELDAWGLDTVRALLGRGGTAEPWPADRLASAARVALAEARA